jgi:hypothetical protein
VRQVAAQRAMITTPAPGTKQSIHYNPIEHEDFVHKLITSQPGALDYFCGPGYQQVYQRQQQSQSVHGPALDDMLLACLIKAGSADGYVKHSVQVYAPLSRRTYGVAAQYRNERRILSDLMWMPILASVKRDSKKKKAAQKRVPSTIMPSAMTKHLLVTVDPSTSEQMYLQEWEEFLYGVIQQERDKWVLLTAVCSVEERMELAETALLIAKTCHNDTNSADCCWVYDTTLRPN